MADYSDLREHGDSELTLNVMNDEGLYKWMRRERRNPEAFADSLAEVFKFTAAQRADLLDTIAGEIAEDAKREAAEAAAGEE